ncbi:MAG: DUF3798 domain-containing protein [Deltaproteobacteria bacterium]|nr:DUF3798 domain-containing protein [Deltaproteobacteria bacterium]
MSQNFRKIFYSVLFSLFVLQAAACSSSQQAAQTENNTQAPQAVAQNIKIGVMTGTVSQGEDEYRAAQAILAKYPGQVLHMTYPDNFMQEQETTISNIVSMASDPEVKAIIVGQAVPGSIAAVKKVRRTRPDILFFFWEAHEDPDQVSEVADILFSNDNINRGRTLVELAKKMGAKRIIHYSFPRHMSYKMLADRRDQMREWSQKLGLEFIFVTAPDPLGEGGIPAAQQFILEDTPRQIEKHGKDTAFFSTNDAMTEPLIRQVAKNGAIFLEPDMPSPTMGFPGALGIEIPQDKAGDFDFINKEIAKKVAELGDSGRLASWPRPASLVCIKAAADMVFESKADLNKIKNVSFMEKVIERHAGTDVTLSPYKEYNNHQLVLMESIIY